MANLIDISILIPVYNSIQSLPILYEEILLFFAKKPYRWELIFVDDASKKETVKVLKSLAEKDNRVTVLSLEKNQGQQKALYLGFQHCTGTYVLTMDDDLQHDIVALDSMLSKAEDGYDLIFGIYDIYEGAPWKRWGSHLIGLFFKLHFPQLNGNHVSSFRLIHRNIYKNLSPTPPSFVYLSAELIPFSQKIGNQRIFRRQRYYGASGHTFSRCFCIGCNLWIHYGFFKTRWKRIHHFLKRAFIEKLLQNFQIKIIEK